MSRLSNLPPGCTDAAIERQAGAFDDEPSPVKITVELEPVLAAALMRLCKKFGHSDAAAYLYPHVGAELRKTQAYNMVYATSAVEKALAAAGVNDWPWVETGSAE